MQFQTLVRTVSISPQYSVLEYKYIVEISIAEVNRMRTIQNCHGAATYFSAAPACTCVGFVQEIRCQLFSFTY